VGDGHPQIGPPSPGNGRNSGFQGGNTLALGVLRPFLGGLQMLHRTPAKFWPELEKI
jgi:hypothetical protein